MFDIFVSYLSFINSALQIDFYYMSKFICCSMYNYFMAVPLLIGIVMGVIIGPILSSLVWFLLFLFIKKSGDVKSILKRKNKIVLSISIPISIIVSIVEFPDFFYLIIFLVVSSSFSILFSRLLIPIWFFDKDVFVKGLQKKEFLFDDFFTLHFFDTYFSSIVVLLISVALFSIIPRALFGGGSGGGYENLVLGPMFIGFFMSPFAGGVSWVIRSTNFLSEKLSIELNMHQDTSVPEQ